MNRSELLFLYDVKWGNPNGDPLDENKPRMDEVTQTLIVTDVRLKRTVRDYLRDFYGETLWVSGDPVTSEERMKELGISGKEDAVEKCIDIRLFGAVIPSKGKGAMETSLTGPVQFRYGRSLHRVSWQLFQGTAAFLSKGGKEQRSFREEYVVPYALIAFYGVINETAAKDSHLTDEDVKKLLEALWSGTKNLITRSKMEQNPRLLIKVNYKEGVRFHHGELDYLVKIVSDKDDFEIRDVSDFSLEIGELVDALKRISDMIESIEYRVDPRLRVTLSGKSVDLEEAMSFVSSKALG